MSKRGDKPRRLMTKIRRQVGKPTMREVPKNVYDRNEWKREAIHVIHCCTHPPNDGSLCAGGVCMCEENYTCDKCEVNDGN